VPAPAGGARESDLSGIGSRLCNARRQHRRATPGTGGRRWFGRLATRGTSRHGHRSGMGERPGQGPAAAGRLLGRRVVLLRLPRHPGRGGGAGRRIRLLALPDHGWRAHRHDGPLGHRAAGAQRSPAGPDRRQDARPHRRADGGHRGGRRRGRHPRLAGPAAALREPSGQRARHGRGRAGGHRRDRAVLRRGPAGGAGRAAAGGQQPRAPHAHGGRGARRRGAPRSRSSPTATTSTPAPNCATAHRGGCRRCASRSPSWAGRSG